MPVKTFKDLKVGDEVFLVENDQRRCKPRYVTVVKVGRKYVYLQAETYSTQKVSAWECDGYSIALSQEFPQCNVFATQEDYEAKIAWGNARNVLSSFGSASKVDKEVRNKIVELLKDQLDL